MKVTINKNNKQIMDWGKILQCLKLKGTNSYNVQGTPTKIRIVKSRKKKIIPSNYMKRCSNSLAKM